MKTTNFKRYKQKRKDLINIFLVPQIKYYIFYSLNYLEMHFSVHHVTKNHHKLCIDPNHTKSVKKN